VIGNQAEMQQIYIYICEYSKKEIEP